MSQNKTKNNILVVGLGLIGSSLSQSLIRSKKVGKVYGYDKDKEVISYAKEKKFINEGIYNLRDGITKSDIINYICIALLIFNIIIIIVQKNDNITWSFFEKGTNALIFSAGLFTALILLVVFW